jgi:hypothetical protein
LIMPTTPRQLEKAMTLSRHARACPAHPSVRQG